MVLLYSCHDRVSISSLSSKLEEQSVKQMMDNLDFGGISFGRNFSMEFEWPCCEGGEVLFTTCPFFFSVEPLCVLVLSSFGSFDYIKTTK